MSDRVDWQTLFVPSLHLGEVMLRGALVYLFILFLMRILRRGAGDIGISDLLVVVLVADAAGNAMSSEYRSFTEGATLVATIVLLDYFVDWLSYQIPALRRLLRPAPLQLIRYGRMQKRNMRREKIQEEELLAQLREKGVDRVEDVKECYLEGNGRVSVIQWASK